MEAGKGTTGGSKRLVRIDEVSRFARPLSADRALPPAPGGTDCGPSPAQDPKRKRLAQLRALRERGIISEKAFRAQRRIQGDSPARLSGPPALSSTPLPRRKTRRWWIAVSPVLLIIAGFGVGRLKVLQSLSHGAVAAAALAAALTANVDPHPQNAYALGKAFRLGTYTYTIAGHQIVATLDSQFSPVRASEGNEYVIVNFSICNDSAKARVVSTEAFVLEDANGAVYRACSQGAAAPRTPLTKGDLWLTEVQPGVTKELAAAFEVPANSLKPPVKLLVFEQGLLGSREAIVYLQ
jgi:hypothetical protein